MLRVSLLSLVLATAAGAGAADTLLLDEVEMAATTADTRPARGTTMDDVEARFGPPSERVQAVGEPPITRWIYPNFTVYFEYDRVIHAVVRH